MHAHACAIRPSVSPTHATELLIAANWGNANLRVPCQHDRPRLARVKSGPMCTLLIRLTVSKLLADPRREAETRHLATICADGR